MTFEIPFHPLKSPRVYMKRNECPDRHRTLTLKCSMSDIFLNLNIEMVDRSIFSGKNTKYIFLKRELNQII